MGKGFRYQISVKTEKGHSYLLGDKKHIKSALDLAEIEAYSVEIESFESCTFLTEKKITKKKKDEFLDMVKPYGEFELKEMFSEAISSP